jgi:hypothetical protein
MSTALKIVFVVLTLNCRRSEISANVVALQGSFVDFSEVPKKSFFRENFEDESFQFQTKKQVSYSQHFILLITWTQ